MAYYEAITIEEMDEVLRASRFYPVSLMYRNRPVKEWVYERKLPRSSNHFVRVYTGINRYGRDAGNSRKSGKDAIRVQVIYRDLKGETLVSQPKRVHRVAGWRNNLKERFDEIATKLPQVEFDSRGEPMTLRKKNKSYFWGSRDYPKYKETKPFRAEEFAADDYDATYGKEQAKIRRKLKNKIKKKAIMGTKAGQWSARKSQELKRQYEAACDKKGLNPYKGKKTKSQDNLSKWSKQKWGTASGRKSSVTGEPYFPAKAVAALKKKDLYSKAKRQKAKATRAGKQNARYSDDIRKVVAQYRAEGIQKFALEDDVCDEKFHVDMEDLENSINRIVERSSRSLFRGDVIRTRQELGMRMAEQQMYIRNWRYMSTPSHTYPDGRKTELDILSVYQHHVDMVCKDLSPQLWAENPNKEWVLDTITERLSKPLYFMVDVDWLLFNQYDNEGDNVDEGGAIESADFLVITNGFSMEWMLHSGFFAQLNNIFDDEPDEYGRSYAFDDYRTMSWYYLGEGREVFYDDSRLENETLLTSSETYGTFPENFYRTMAQNELSFEEADKWVRVFMPSGGNQISEADKDATFLPFQFVYVAQIGGESDYTDSELYDEGYTAIESDEIRTSALLPSYNNEVESGDYLYGAGFRRAFFAEEPEDEEIDVEWEDEWEKPNDPDWEEEIDWEAEESAIGWKTYSWTEPQKYAVAVIEPNENQKRLSGGVSGVVNFIQEGKNLHIDYEILGLTDGEHGFHIHEYGDLTDGCESACSHFNPYGHEHGGLDSEVRHLGDLGNVTSKDGKAKGRISTDTISLEMGKINCIVGRMIIVHADRDDLGLGGDAESLKTGNAGKRVGCGVIGLAEPPKTKEAEDEEITLKEFDDTGVGKDQMFRNLDDKIAFQLRNYNKTNRYGDIGCPVCNSIGLFGSEIIAKGRKWFCWDCGYEEKIESIKSRGDITLEKYGMLIKCPVCERAVKAYNNDSMQRHIKKCRDKHDMATKED